jgi:xanthine dehydrogenase accessory factor
VTIQHHRIGNADHQRILAQAQAWRGADMAIATVIETWSSAPCPLGTHMLVHNDGRFVGSVSGGCVEGDVLARATEVIASGTHQAHRYGVSDGAAWEVGLPCGGDISVLIQPVCEDDLLDRIAVARAAGKSVLIGTDIGTGMSHVVQGLSPDGDCPSDTEARPERDSSHAGTVPIRVFTNLYAPAKRVLIIGAVEIAASLAAIARQLDVTPTIIDPRARFLTAERFPGVTLDDRWPDEAIAALAPDDRSAIITLSHDPKIDDPALIAALATPVSYIAALGSKRSHHARLDRLRAAGVDAAALERIEGPAGVTINSITAAEIALSIAGGMVRALNDGRR